MSNFDPDEQQPKRPLGGPKRFEIRNIPPQAEEHEVKLSIARAYHTAIAQMTRRRQNDDDEKGDKPVLMNFEVKLRQWEDSSGWLKPTGSLLIPSWSGLFKEYIASNPVYVKYLPDWNDKETFDSARLQLVEDSKRWRQAEVNHLRSTPWQDPRDEVEHKERVRQLRYRCQVMEIQFGFDNFRKIGRADPVHQFCVEWCRKFDSKTDARAHMEFMDAIHAIQIQIGDHTTPSHDFIKVRYENIKEIAVKSTTLIFSMWTPPILENGPIDYDEERPRSRLSGLDEQHKRVISVFPKQFRATLYSHEELNQFKSMAQVVGLKVLDAHPSLDTDTGLGQNHGANKRTKRRAGDYLNYLTDVRMNEINDKWLKLLPFSVAFQIASMMQNGLLNPIEIRSMQDWVRALLSRESESKVADLLYHFSQSIPSWTISTRLESTLKERFDRFRDNFLKQKSGLLKTLKLGWFWCYRATITPTTIRFEGPSQEQSNGTVRRYHYATEAFLRVNFTDEDRVQVRWDRDIDGESFVRERLGGILHNGLEIAGRRFEFLGYSNSGLREHSLWFVTPFKDHAGELVDANVIRGRVGDFSSKKNLEYQPSKLGARLAQSFSTTEPSVELQEDEIEEREDIVAEPVTLTIKVDKEPESGNEADAEQTENESNPDTSRTITVVREFTDGYGCMSLELSNQIWRALNPDAVELPKPAPAAYQIRIGGAKGVIGIDPNLEGRKIVLHKSMVKFKSQDRGLHIATKFDHPLPLFLNRPLVAILEHQGIKIEWFKRLQERAISDANNTLLSISEKAAEFFIIRHLGRSYGVSNIIRYLAKYGITRPQLEDAPHPWLTFFLRSLDIAMVHIDRELKYRARIPVPSGISLVGVADVHGELEEGQVYVCIQRADEESQYFPAKPGYIYVTRSPQIHPGDIQRLMALHPPEGSVYKQFPMINCIVFSCKGKRPPANMLGGGDLDGDLFNLLVESDEFKLEVDLPAEYPPVEPLRLDRPATIDDIADFVVEYVNNDKMGLISIQHLIISDQSRDGLHDESCMKLAELHSKAVDFAKSGVAISMSELPRKLHKFVPDFQYKETLLDDRTKYYESPKALGVLFRNIKVRTVEWNSSKDAPTPLGDHPIWKLLISESKPYLPSGAGQAQEAHVKGVFDGYVRQLKGIKTIYTLGRSPLSEEEVYMGTILAHANNRRREDMSAMLREVSGQLVDHVRTELMGFQQDPLHVWLARSLYGWQWAWAEASSTNPDGSVVKDRQESRCSFGMIALRCAFECLDVIKKRRPDLRRSRPRV